MLLNLDNLFKIFIIILLSGLIGYNREKSDMHIGMTTHIFVGLSAVILQILALNVINTSIGYSVDLTRLGGQMLTGIGFLGAGAILKDDKHVRGLTTAASIFLVACLGLAVGFGYYLLSIAATLICYILLTYSYKRKIVLKKLESASDITCISNYNRLEEIINILNKSNILIKSINTINSNKKIRITIKVSPSIVNKTDIINNLTKIEDCNFIISDTIDN